jgi:uncharacterized lipoprotein YbaY
MSRSSIARIALLAVAIVLSAAMASAQPVRHPLARVTGELTFRENLEFLPGTIVKVEIREMGPNPRSGLKPLADVVIRDPKRVPIPFAVLYDPANLKLDREYVLHARVYARRIVEHTSGPGVPVITLGNPTRNVRVPMNPVRSRDSLGR